MFEGAWGSKAAFVVASTQPLATYYFRVVGRDAEGNAVAYGTTFESLGFFKVGDCCGLFLLLLLPLTGGSSSRSWNDFSHHHSTSQSPKTI